MDQQREWLSNTTYGEDQAETAAAPDFMPQLVADVYDQAPARMRARVLECLLGPVGPLGLVAIAAGAFGCFLKQRQWNRLSIPAEQALRINGAQIAELVRFVVQVDPDILRQLLDVLTGNVASIGKLSGPLLVIALRISLARRVPLWRKREADEGIAGASQYMTSTAALNT